MADSTSSVGRIFLSPEEVHTQWYNTHIFKWTPGLNEEDPCPEHYIYCDNDKGIINQLSCSITLYDGKWREIKYDTCQKKFEVKGDLSFLYDYDAEPPSSPGVLVPPWDDDEGYTPYVNITSDIRNQPIPTNLKGKSKMTTTQTQITTHTKLHILSDNTTRAANLQANVWASLNWALRYQPHGGGPPDNGGSDDSNNHEPPGGGGGPLDNGPPDGAPPVGLMPDAG
jgi:hypothetical protein